MKVIVVLIGSWLLAMAVSKGITGDWYITQSGNIAMCAMLLFSAIAHFAFPKGMAMMIPSFIPFKLPLVYLTGIMEIGFGAGLLFPTSRHQTAILLIGFFILILPANISAAMRHVDLEKATFTGNGPRYL